MATLITGGAGFVGLAIAERLVADGERAVLFDIAAPPADSLARPELAGVAYVRGDIRQAADVIGALASETIDRVIHTAAVTPNQQRERDDPGGIVDVNIGGTVNLLACAAVRPSVQRVVVLSSVAVYGFARPAPSGLFEEDLSNPAPAALYGITKLAAEQAALRIGELHNLDVRVVRLGPVYGRWERATGVRDALSPHYQVLQAALSGSEAVLPRAMRADWVYSRDAAAGIARVCAGDRLRHLVYHVGGGKVTDLPAWCRLIAAQFPSFRWRIADTGEEPSVVYGLTADRAPLGLARLTRDTGFAPAYSLEMAAADYLAWMADQDMKGAR